MAHAAGQVGEGPRRPGRPRAGVRLQGGAQLLVGEGEHAAAGVVDEDDLLGAQQVLADRQGADRVLGDQSAGVADDVRLTRGEPQGREDVHARVHAGHDGDLLLPLGRQAAPGENLGAVGGVAGDKSLGDGHGSSVSSSRRRAGPPIVPDACDLTAVSGYLRELAQQIAVVGGR